MDNPMVKGDEVRHGTYIYLDAISKEIIDSLGDAPLSEALLYSLNDGSIPFFPTTAKQVAQLAKAADGLAFTVRLCTDKKCVGVCRFGDISWQSRHARLHISILEESYFAVDILADTIQTMLQFAYWEANLNRIYVYCIEDTRLLRQALEQVGFTNEGRLRQEVYRDKRYLDKLIYGILCREWSA